jgi:hypothetical protein
MLPPSHARLAATAAVIFAALFVTRPLVAQTTITFDDEAAPCFFAEATAVTTHYAALGVTFSASPPEHGGLILDACSDFGVPARSGINFLAYNAYGGFGGPQDVLFARPVSVVSLWASGGYAVGTFTLEAFDVSGQLLGTRTVSSPVGAYEFLEIVSSQIARVHLVGNTPDAGAPVFVVDDLSFTAPASAVPEPATLALLVGGASMWVIWRRRPRGQTGQR